jgi:hypothetical protein
VKTAEHVPCEDGRAPTEMEVAMAVEAVVESKVKSSCGRRNPKIVALSMARDPCLRLLEIHT